MIQIGPAGIQANISYYASIEQQLRLKLLEAQTQKEYWQRELHLQQATYDNT